MIINIDENYFAQPRCRLLGNKGETMSRRLEVRFPKVENAQLYKLRFLLSDNTTCYELDVTSGEAYVSGSLLVQVGKVLCQWIAVGIGEDEQYEVVAKSNVFEMFVDDSIDSDGEPIPTYEQAADMFDRTVAALEEVEKIVPQFSELSTTVVENGKKLTTLWARHDADILNTQNSIVELGWRHDDEMEALTQKHDADIKNVSDKVESEISNVTDLINNAAVPIVSSVYGESVSVTDSIDRPFKSLSIYGKTTQNGTPTPEAPVELESVGELATITVCGKNLFNPKDRNIVPSISDGQDITTIIGISSHYIKVDTTKKYVTSNIGGGNTYWFAYDKSKQYLGYKVGTSLSEALFVSYPDTAFIRIRMDGSDVTNPQVEIGTAPTAYEPYKAQSFFVLTPNGLRGIPVLSGGNYTDDSGQQWVCDEIDFERGLLIQRCFAEIVTLKEQVGLDRYTGTTTYSANVAVVDDIAIPVLSSDLPYDSQAGVQGMNGIRMASSAKNTVIARYNNEILSSVNVLYPLEKPIETPLTAEQIAAFKALHSYCLNTTVTNDSGAGMKISYTADTKTYIDNQFKVLFALISTM